MPPLAPRFPAITRCEFLTRQSKPHHVVVERHRLRTDRRTSGRPSGRSARSPPPFVSATSAPASPPASCRRTGCRAATRGRTPARSARPTSRRRAAAASPASRLSIAAASVRSTAGSGITSFPSYLQRAAPVARAGSTQSPRRRPRRRRRRVAEKSCDRRRAAVARDREIDPPESAVPTRTTR